MLNSVYLIKIQINNIHNKGARRNPIMSFMKPFTDNVTDNNIRDYKL